MTNNIEWESSEREIEVVSVRQGIPQDITAMPPQEFARICREYLEDKIRYGEYEGGDTDIRQNPGMAWLDAQTMKYLSDELGITGAYLHTYSSHQNDKNHWNTILSADENGISTYDPQLIGERYHFMDEIENVDIVLAGAFAKIQKTKVPYTPKEVLIDTRCVTINSDEIIERLGGIQEDEYNCGPLCLYAAKMAGQVMYLP